MASPIALAIPLFFVAIGTELVVGRMGWGRVRYHFPTAIADLACGITQQASTFFLAPVLVLPFAAIDAAVPWELSGLGGHLLAFLGVDAMYYAWHRFTHECRLGWLTHVVHHQSEDYNLAVALRQTLTSAISSVPFYLPLAALGVPTEIFLLHTALNTLYQFWIHTEAIGKLGPLEWVLNTPSHHRVHHGVNPEYLDKNYAGVLIIWDRLFGTFEPEVATPVYGTVVPSRTTNPLRANVEPFVALARQCRSAPTWSDAVRHALSAPGHPSPWLSKPEADLQRQPWVPSPTPARIAAVALSFPLVAVAVVALLALSPGWTFATGASLALGIVAATVAWAWLLEETPDATEV
jgi:sterol desaturase/sphingolipid hydroxylase (fatty acid hydroxylase superfamily)